jgi:hypothetical protein
MGREAKRPTWLERVPSRPLLITLLQGGYLIWAVVEIALGRPGKAVALVAVFLVLQVPRLMRLPAVFDVAFLVAWSLQELGQVAGFWSLIPWWDTLVHAALPAVLAPTGAIILMRAGLLPDILEGRAVRQRLGAVMIVFLLAAGFGTVYEIYEWFSDSNLGTHYQPDNTDTMTDITANDLGGLAGGLLLVAAAAGGWRPTRDDR